MTADPATALVDTVVSKLTSMNGHIGQLMLEAKANVAEHFIMGSKDLMDALNNDASAGASVAAAADAASAKSSLAAFGKGAKQTVDLLIAKKSVIQTAGLSKEIGVGVTALKQSAASFLTAIAPKLALSMQLLLLSSEQEAVRRAPER